MTVTEFEGLADFILAPLAGQPDDVWHGGPPGKWSPGEVVCHLSVAITASADGIGSRRDKPPMRRRPGTPFQRLARPWLLTTGLFPPGLKAPQMALPRTRPDRAATESQLRSGVAKLAALAAELLPRRGRDLYVKHPVLGDLTIEEWMRFHVVHARHHTRQIQDRVKWAVSGSVQTPKTPK